MAEGFWMPCGVQHSQEKNSHGCLAWLGCFLLWQEARGKQQESDWTAMLREVDWPIRDLEDVFYGLGFRLSQNSGPGSVFRLWSVCSNVETLAARIQHSLVLGPAEFNRLVLIVARQPLEQRAQASLWCSCKGGMKQRVSVFHGKGASVEIYLLCNFGRQKSPLYVWAWQPDLGIAMELYSVKLWMRTVPMQHYTLQTVQARACPMNLLGVYILRDYAF